MDRITKAWTRIGGYVACMTTRFSRRSVLMVVGVLSAGLLWVIAVAPTVIAFALTAGLAAAWCAWLEKHPEAPLHEDGLTDDGIGAGAPPTFAVHVLATTPAGTRSALAVAKRLTAANPARVVLAVPRLTSFATQFDPTGIERTAVIDGNRALAAEVGVHVTVLLCVCRRLDDVVHSLLGRTGFVIVGRRLRGFWPSREQRLVRRLVGEGYRVVFAGTGTRSARAQVRCLSS